jgi:hypothetical protein
MLFYEKVNVTWIWEWNLKIKNEDKFEIVGYLNRNVINARLIIMLISKYSMQKIAPEDNKKIISPLKKSKII